MILFVLLEETGYQEYSYIIVFNRHFFPSNFSVSRFIWYFVTKLRNFDKLAPYLLYSNTNYTNNTNYQSTECIQIYMTGLNRRVRRRSSCRRPLFLSRENLHLLKFGTYFKFRQRGWIWSKKHVFQTSLALLQRIPSTRNFWMHIIRRQPCSKSSNRNQPSPFFKPK